MKPLNRREFLTLSGLTVGGLTLGSRLLNTQALAQIATGAFPSLAQIPTRTLEPGLLEANLIARQGATTIGGQPAKLLTYGGSLLRVKAGETLRINFTNKLEQPTNLHWHGLHASPSIDDPFRMVAPGESVSVDYPVPKDASGLNWFHPHHHGVVAEQQFAGLTGAIAIESDLDVAFAEAEEHVILLRDYALENGLPAKHTMMDWMNGKEGVLQGVNAAIKPTLKPQKSLVRLRIVNAANARYFRLKLENHPLYLIGTDGGFLERPVELTELLIAPGERADVIVRLERAGTYRLQNLPYERGKMKMGGMMGGMNMGDSGNSSTGDSGMGGMNMGDSSNSGTGNSGMGNSGMGGMNHSGTSDTGGMDHSGMAGMSTGGDSQPVTLMVLNVPKLSKPSELPSRLATIPVLETGPSAVTRTITLTEKMMQMKFFLNGKSFDGNRVDISGKLGTLEVWELVNKSDMDHPFHLHSFPFQVISRNGRPEPYRAWRDVVNLKKDDRLRIAVPLSDFTGKTVYHCHVLEHEDRGMMGVLEVTA